MPKPPPDDGRTEISPLTGARVKPGSNRTGTKNSPTAGKPGRKPMPIDWNHVGILAGLHATQDEIAGYLNISKTQLTLRYEIEHDGETLGDFIRSKRDGGKAKLRVLQMESAKTGSVPMQIFLGKNWLGQSDKIEHAATEKSPLFLNYKDPSDEDGNAVLLEVGGTIDDCEGIDIPEGDDLSDDDLVSSRHART
jgi:hypothetical protein